MLRYCCCCRDAVMLLLPLLLSWCCDTTIYYYCCCRDTVILLLLLLSWYCDTTTTAAGTVVTLWLQRTCWALLSYMSFCQRPPSPCWPLLPRPDMATRQRDKTRNKKQSAQVYKKRVTRQSGKTKCLDKRHDKVTRQRDKQKNKTKWHVRVTRQSDKATWQDKVTKWQRQGDKATKTKWQSDKTEGLSLTKWQDREPGQYQKTNRDRRIAKTKRQDKVKLTFRTKWQTNLKHASALKNSYRLIQATCWSWISTPDILHTFSVSPCRPVNGRRVCVLFFPTIIWSFSFLLQFGP